MQKFIKVIYLLSLVLLMTQCKDDDNGTTINPGDPSDLNIEWVMSETVEGMVEIKATATDALFFEFDPADGSDLINNSDGNFTHNYEATGTYNAVVKAVGSSGRFLTQSNTFVINLSDDEITEYPGFQLMWSDEFNSNALDNNIWNYEIGNGCPNLCGWGNQELEYYRQENTAVTGGNLVITAKQETFQNSNYTSSRLTTQNKFTFKHGRVDIRAKLPKGQGIWPALWMLGENITSVGWPRCGEIDIMEMVGGNASGRDNTTHGTIHWDNQGHQFSGGSRTLPTGILNDDFHLYSILWDEDKIQWFLDDMLYHVENITVDKAEFNEEFFLIFNVAVGGTWPGNPTSATSFPQQMQVDYIRVYQEN